MAKVEDLGKLVQRLTCHPSDQDESLKMQTWWSKIRKISGAKEEKTFEVHKLSKLPFLEENLANDVYQKWSRCPWVRLPNSMLSSSICWLWHPAGPSKPARFLWRVFVGERKCNKNPFANEGRLLSTNMQSSLWILLVGMGDCFSSRPG